MTIAFRSDSETTNGTAGTSCVVTKPAGAVDGDELFAFIAINDAGAITAPAGWTAIASGTHGSAPAIRMAAYRKTAASEGASWTWTFASSRNWGWVGAYTGVAATDIINGWDLNQGFTDTGGSEQSSPRSTNNVGLIDSAHKHYALIYAVANVKTASGSAVTYTNALADTERAELSTNAGAGTDISGAVYDDVNHDQDDRGWFTILTSSAATLDSIAIAFVVQPAMTAYDGGRPNVTVRMAFGADPDGDPDLWTWTDVSNKVLHSQGISIWEGAQNEAGRPPPTNLTLALRNPTGDFTPEHPASQYWPNVIERVPIEVSVPYGYAIPTQLACCFVASYAPDWLDETAGVPGGAIVRITAAGYTRQSQQGSPRLRPALERAMISSGGLGVPPGEYWPMQDGASAVLASSAVGGISAGVSGVTFAADSSIDGSDPCATVSSTGYVAGTVRAYEDTGLWFFAFSTVLTAPPGADITLAEIFTSGGTAHRWLVQIHPNFFGAGFDRLVLFVYDTSNVLLSTMDMVITVADYDIPSTIGVSAKINGTGIDARVSIVNFSISGGSAFATIANSTQGTPFTWKISGSAALSNAPVCHIGIITDASFDTALSGGIDDIARALDGYAGDYGEQRFTRLCGEEHREYEIIGESPSAGETALTMGPQPSTTFLGALRDVEDLVLGTTIHDGGVNGALVLTKHNFRYNAQVRMTLDMEGKQLARGFKPIFDDQRRRDSVTVSREGGGSATVSAVTTATAGTEKVINVETDEFLEVLAGQRLSIGQAPGARYPKVSTDLRRAPGTLEGVLRSRIGSRIQVTNLMLQHPDTTDVDAYIEGRGMRIDNERWVVDYILSPAQPWLGANVEDPNFGRLDCTAVELAEAVDTDDTVFDIATTAGPLATVDSAEWTTPDLLYLDLGGYRNTRGEKIRITDIDASLITFGTTGTASHANNASVTPGIPASVATGDYLLCAAAIRNSGTGVPNTPTGYTRLPVFAASSNVQVFAKIAASGAEAAPTVTFTGGVAGADTSAQMCRIAGNFYTVLGAYLAGTSQLNVSAQNIAYPFLWNDVDNCIVFYLGWKQDDWTSVATIAGATEIGEPSTTTGDDQAFVWDYVIQTTAASIQGGDFTVTGGASAISRGAVFAIRCDKQTVTAVRSVNGVVKSHAIGARVRLWDGMHLPIAATRSVKQQ